MKRPRLHRGLLGALLSGVLGLGPGRGEAAELLDLDYTVTGRQLQITPASLAVPKGIPGSFRADLLAGGQQAPVDGTFVEATLRGPSFPARRIVGAPGEPILLPPLNLVGEYSLDGIRLVDSASNETILEGSPPRIPITVFDEVLIARVTSRPLTTEEIQQRGIVIDENNFRAVEFEVGFVVDGKTIPVKFPVVAPAFYNQTEIIPQAEIDERLAQAELINEELTVGLPPELEATGLEIEVKGLNIQFVDPGEGEDLALSIPPIAGLVVIPGKIGFLNQFFAVQVFVENAAPVGSGLSVTDITAELVLPAGDDRIPAESYEQPGDDPLRFARVGPEAIIQNVLPVTKAGADGVFGTADDGRRLGAGGIGQCEFLVEGLREGLHVMDVKLAGTLEGLVAGPVAVEGRAAGSILVRNPNFSLAFSHPRTIRTGEPYTASVTILNTSSAPANQVSVTLPEASISGARLTSEATVFLGDIAPGQTATADYRLVAQRTGSITFSNLTSDDDIVGRFRLRMGVDERGVPLSPDSIGYPEFVEDLPTDLFAAADRVLGQALSIATAGQLPPGVQDIPNDGAFVTSKVSGRVLYRLPPRIVQRRIIELAEAGQRLRYGDEPERVLADLLLDWQGARDFNLGFDQILKVTDAGRQWRETIANLLDLEQAGLDPNQRLADRAADLAGRGEAWWASASGDPRVEAGFVGDEDPLVTYGFSDLDQAGGYRSLDGGLLFLPPQEAGRFAWRTTDQAASTTLSVLILAGDGTGRRIEWAGVALPAGASAAFDPAAGELLLQVDDDGDGSPDRTVTGIEEAVAELPPRVIGAIQDVEVEAGRPRFQRCTPTPVDINGKPHNNYGTIVGVLFSKPMERDSVEDPASFALDDGTPAVSVAVQPGGRVALLNLSQGIGLTQRRDPVSGETSLRQHDLRVAGVADPRGGELDATAVPVGLTAIEGVAIEGRVVRADGSAAANVPVTLTYYEQAGLFCASVKVRPTQVRTDSEGRFSLDFVMAGVPYSLSATDTGGLSDEAIAIILQASQDDEVTRRKLLELASQPNVAETLLEEFAVGGLQAAVARAEGLDRALLKDVIEIGSGRVGSETPVALRFRGRATVQGRVLASDGATPVPDAAVNLFPDPSSREKGRGVVTGSDGSFEFFGVPLGIFSLQAQAPDGTTRAVSETLTEAGEVRELEVVLSAGTAETTRVSGFVYEADGFTPHSEATVFVGEFPDNNTSQGLRQVVAVATTDVNGFYSAEGVTVGSHDLLAISVDGKRRAIRLDAGFSAGATTVVNLALQARATVRGRVEFADGRPAANAIVAGGLALVRTDEGGNFVLEGVPTGRRPISAGLERNEAEGIRFPRIGSTTLEVVPGDSNFAVVRFASRGSITGRVLTQSGEPVPGMNVALPLGPDSFAYTRSDAAGVYLFENIELKEWTVSAPAPAASNSGELIDQALDTIGGAARGEQVAQEDLLGAITDAFTVFTGINDPLINGEGLNFNPISWGYEKVRLSFDGQVANADVVFLPEGTVSGTVLNGQGVPIGARVRLTGIGPTRVGDVGFIIRGERNSDPATGIFEFPGQALAGPYGLQAASPFFPVVVAHNGATNRVDPDATGIVLQFPPVEETNGRLVGTVLDPDGLPVGADVPVTISFGDNYTIQTRDDGTFDTQIDLPAGGYSVEAEFDGLRGRAYVNVQPGITNEVTVRLLGKGSLDIRVTLADGTPVPDASVVVRKGSFPSEDFDLVTGADGQAFLGNAFEGSYSVQASAVIGPTRIRGSKGATVLRGETTTATVVLQATGTIRGRFLEDDGVTPVPFAQIILGGGIGFATTDAGGAFEVIGLPLGAYRLIATEPVSGRLGVATTSLGFDGQVVDLILLVRSLGEVRGGVLNSARSGFVPGAVVTLRPSDGLTPERQVTTGPDGRFTFPGTAEGSFVLAATDPVSGLRGSASGRLDPGVSILELDIPLEARGEIEITVLEADGSTPANATVTMRSGGTTVTGDSDAEGIVRLGDLPLGNYTLTAQSMAPERGRDGVRQTVGVSQPGPNLGVDVVLSGVGTLRGLVLESDGTTPASNATVVLSSSSPALGPETRNFVTGADGSFRFDGVAVGSWQLSASSLALAASASGALAGDGQEEVVDLILGDNGRVRGRLLRADGVTPVADLEVGVFFDSQSGALGVKTDVTAADGSFEMSGVPAGPFGFEGLLPSVNGIARVASEVTTNGEVVELGEVLLDEDDLRVVSVVPADNSVDVPVLDDVLVTFNEPIDPASFDANGICLCDDKGTVAATLTVEGDGTTEGNVVRLHPSMPLDSERTYRLVVLDGDRLAAGSGGVAARGPRDRVGRPLVVPFQSTFVTEDARPPMLLSLTPADEAEQVDVRSVVRLSFDESLDPAGLVVMLSGPGGFVAGSTALGVDGRVVAFTPEVDLAPNASYTVMASGFRDLAGNGAAGQPYTSTFSTLDTLGPEIAEIRIKGGVQPVSGAPVEFEAVLAVPEDQVRVRMTADLVVIGETTEPGDLDLPFTLPLDGSVTVRAIAIDRHGNEGPLAERVIEILGNQPPVITVTQTLPASGPLTTGSPFQFRVEASDDAGVVSFRAAVTGGAEVPLRSNVDGSPIFLSGVVLAEAGPGLPLTVVAQASDSSGDSTPELSFEFEVVDATDPALAIVGPESGSEFAAGATVPVLAEATDNFGVTEIDYAVSGAFALSGVATVSDPAPGSQPVAIGIDVPPEVVEDGAAFTVVLSARDAAGNLSPEVSRDFALRDAVPPTLVELVPADGATGVNFRSAVVATFSEPLDPDTLTAGAVTLVRSEDGAAVPSTVSLAGSGERVLLRPEAPLEIATPYRFSMADTVSDPAGNPLEEAVSATFTTTDFRILTPAEGSPVVEGAPVEFTAGGEDIHPVNLVRYSLGEEVLGQGGPPQFSSTIVLLPPAGDEDPVSVPVRAEGFVSEVNIALLGVASQSTTGFGGDAALAIDGNTNGNYPAGSVTHTNNVANSYWEVDLQAPSEIASIVLHNRSDCCAQRLTNFRVSIRDEGGTPVFSEDFGGLPSGSSTLEVAVPPGTVGRVVRVQLNGLNAEGTGYLSLAEVEVLAPPSEEPLLATSSSFEVHRRSGDADEDGIDNGTEVDNGLDPFFDDTGEDPDGDTLTNAEEVSLGTDPFDEDSDGDGLRDDVDPDPLTPMSGSAPVAGQSLRAGALAFDGSDDLVAIDGRALGGLDDFTLEFWLNTTDTGYNTVFSGARSGQFNALIAFFLTDTEFRLSIEGIEDDSWVIESIADGLWHHYAVTRNATTGEAEFFIDGLSQGVIQVPTNRLSVAANGFFLGQEQDSLGGGFDASQSLTGELDEVRIWNRVRTQVELRQGARRRLVGLESGLTGYWHFDEGRGDTSFDRTVETRDARLGGGAVERIPAWVSDAPASFRAPVFEVAQDTPGTAVELIGLDPDGAALTATLTTLPARGRLYQTADGTTKGSEILAADLPAMVANAGRLVIYEAEAGFAGDDPFAYRVSDPSEDSVPTPATFRVRATNQPPVAMDDAPPAYQDVPTVIPVLDNDSDPDADEMDVVSFTQPANGTVTLNPDGTLTYEPPGGFTGVETFTYTIGDRERWRRSENYDPGTTNFSFAGNPSTDIFGFPVWRMEYAQGDEAGGAAPWYAVHGARLVWDPFWFNSSPLWAKGNDTSPPVYATGMHEGGLEEPLIRWIAPYDSDEVDILGRLRTLWTANSGPVDVEVVIAHEDAATGVVTELLMATVSKPSDDTSQEFVFTPVELREIAIGKGDTIVITQRPVSDAGGTRYLNDNELVILPSSAANTATVTLDVRANQRPVATAPAPGSGLEFGGSRVTVPNAPELQITGDQTIEMWLKPADFDQRRNPWAKAYAGEGTLTQETNGTINYFYGIAGNNSGSGGSEYTAINTRYVLPLGEWTHVAVVRDLTGGKLRWFVNGRLTNEIDALFPAAVAGSLDVLIGAGYVSAYNGGIDEVRLWSVARTQAEIQATLFQRLAGTEPGLAGYWPFEAGAGTVAVDASPSGNDGTLGSTLPVWNPSFVPFEDALVTDEDQALPITLEGTDGDGEALTAKVTRLPDRGALFQTDDGVTPGEQLHFGNAGALRFDGVDDYVQVGPEQDLEFTDNLTIEAWIRPASDTSGIIVNKEGEYEVARTADGTIQWAFANTSPGWVFVSTGWVPPLDEWSHVAVSYEGGTVRTYANGVLVDTFNGSGPIGDFNTHTVQDDFRIGGRQGAIQFFHGDLDEVRIWSRVRTGEEIAADFGERLTGSEPGLAGYWDFEEGSGTLAADLSSNGFDGVLGNGVAGDSPTWIIGQNPVFDTTDAIEVTDPQRRVIYIPDRDAVGIDSFDYVVSDGKVDSLEASYVVRVTPVNDPPVAVDDTGGSTVTGVPIPTGNVLTNDFDVDQDPFEIASFDLTSEQGGSVASNGDGTFAYTPPAGFSGTDRFSYSLTDGIAEGPAGTVTIEVLPLNTFMWNNAAGGNWQDPANWTPNGVPGSGDLAIIGLGGDYTVNVSNVSVTVSVIEMGGSSGTQTLLLNGPNLTVENQAIFGPTTLFRFANGSIRGSGAVYFDGEVNWTNGSMLDAGRRVNRGTFTMDISGANLLLRNDTRFENEGTVIYQGGTQNSGGDLYLDQGSTWFNAPGALLDIQTVRELKATSGTRGVFTNEGEVRKGGEGTTSTEWDFRNAGGEVNIVGSRLSLDRGGSSTGGTWSVSEGTLLRCGGETFTFDAASTVSGAGTFEVTGGTVNFNAPFGITGPVVLSGGSWFQNSDATFTGPLSFANGSLRGSGAVFIEGGGTWTNGQMLDGGRKVNRGTLTMDISGANLLMRNGCRFENEGTVIYQGGSQTSGGDLYLDQGSTWFNASGALLDIQTVRELRATSGTRGVFTNEGEVRKGASGTIFTDWNLTNRGVLSLVEGELDLRREFVQDDAGGTLFLLGGNLRKTGTLTLAAGSLTGSGTIFSNLTNQGATIQPGGNVGTISVSGNFVQTAGGTLEMELSGNVASGNFDVLAVSGTADLGGTFRLVAGAFAATPGEKYDMITYASRLNSSTFDLMEGVTGQNGTDYAAMYETDRFSLTAAVAAPPAADALAAIVPPGDATYEQWHLAAFGPEHLEDETICGELADPDADGICNLLEYAFGGDPLRPSPPDILPRVATDLVDGNGVLSVSHLRRKSSDLRYIAETSTDLQAWTTGPGEVDEMFVTELSPPSPNFERVTLRRVVERDSAPRAFLRVRVERRGTVGPAFVLRVERDPDSGEFVLSWPSRTGHSYTVEASLDALSWQDLELHRGIPGSGAVLERRVARGEEPRRLFRVREEVAAGSADEAAAAGAPDG